MKVLFYLATSYNFSFYIQLCPRRFAHPTVGVIRRHYSHVLRQPTPQNILFSICNHSTVMTNPFKFKKNRLFVAKSSLYFDIFEVHYPKMEFVFEETRQIPC